MGLKSGVPDLCLPTAHGGYVGLYIEMKIKPKDCKGTVKWENGKVYYTTNFLGKGSLEEVNDFNDKVNSLCEGYF